MVLPLLATVLPFHLSFSPTMQNRSVPGHSRSIRTLPRLVTSASRGIAILGFVLSAGGVFVVPPPPVPAPGDGWTVWSLKSTVAFVSRGVTATSFVVSVALYWKYRAGFVALAGPQADQVTPSALVRVWYAIAVPAGVVATGVKTMLATRELPASKTFDVYVPAVALRTDIESIFSGTSGFGAVAARTSLACAVSAEGVTGMTTTCRATSRPST